MGRDWPWWGIFIRAAIALAFFLTTLSAPQAQTGSFIPPPRTIADITAILDQEKPDVARITKLRADANAKPTAAVDQEGLWKFYFDRARARRLLGRIGDALADCEKAMEMGHLQPADLWNIQNYIVQLLNLRGEPHRLLNVLAEMEREYDRPGRMGYLFNIYMWQIRQYLVLGNIAQAEATFKKSELLLRQSRAWPNATQYRLDHEWQVEEPRARILEARGRFKEAEEAYGRTELLLKQTLAFVYRRPNPPPRGNLELVVDDIVAQIGRMRALQGKLAEAEADVRRALLSQLKRAGRYNPDTPGFITRLAIVLGEQARHREAEKLMRAALDTLRALGVVEDSQGYVGTLNFLAFTLQRQGRWQEATAAIAELDNAIKGWDASRSEWVRINALRMFTLYNTNQVEKGIEIGRLLVARNIRHLGENHFDTARSRGQLGIGLALAGRDREAMKEFNAALSILMSVSRLPDDGGGAGTLYDVSVRSIVEPYLALLARTSQADRSDGAIEGFRLADLIRSRPVQKSLAESSARAAARNPTLTILAREEQDLQRELGAQLGLVNNVLAAAPEERDDKATVDLRARIDKLRETHRAAKAEIARKFPSYDNLVDPKPSTVEEIRAALKPGEAFVSLYVGGQNTFTWVVPKEGPVGFSMAPIGARAIAGKVAKLRQAVEPHAALISNIPPFDVALAHELYAALLQPVEASWRPAKHLIVAANGALGMLPLGLLPTAAARINPDEDTPFATYREVPWLIRTHAVTMVPSAASLRTLRQLPPGSAAREKLIGFGDPYFSLEEAAEAAQDPPTMVADATGPTSRGAPLGLRAAPQTTSLDSAQLAELPRLPDTSIELRSIAAALGVDPARALHLGKDANEKAVKTLDLSRYRVVAFATHGLVPGDLDGLTQPALALTAPSVAGIDGDGLLTMEEILGLKLDADWVVLSACNTGAGSGAGAEAASGLGSAFFYAGTRAVLVTNWSVQSASARELVTDLFRRQAADPQLTRAAALKEAMNAMIDGPGFSDASGKTVYTYAHPLFWAPYTMIGDGG
jgi:CHAT domain-containing protein/tetratricopeptide (TPR) repeat protein